MIHVPLSMTKTFLFYPEIVSPGQVYPRNCSAESLEKFRPNRGGGLYVSAYVNADCPPPSASVSVSQRNCPNAVYVYCVEMAYLRKKGKKGAPPCAGGIRWHWRLCAIYDWGRQPSVWTDSRVFNVSGGNNLKVAMGMGLAISIDVQCAMCYNVLITITHITVVPQLQCDIALHCHNNIQIWLPCCSLRLQMEGFPHLNGSIFDYLGLRTK